MGLSQIDLSHLISTEQLLADALTSLVLLALLLVLRYAALRTLRGTQALTPELKRRWTVQLRNMFVLMFFVGLAVIWAKELQALAFSLVAVAVAFVIAFKEFILCIMGGIYKTSTRPFILGDIVEIGGLRGEVIDHDLLSTTLVEFGPGTTLHLYTGRIVKIPNSLLLSQPVCNETKQSRFVLHTAHYPFRREDDWQLARKLLLEIAQSVCEPFLEEAVKSFARQSEREGFEMPAVKPLVSVKFQEADEIHLYLRFPTPAQRKGLIEQRISQTFLERFFPSAQG